MRTTESLPCAVAQFTFVIRKRIKLNQEQALWVFVEKDENGKKTQVLPPTRLVSEYGEGITVLCSFFIFYVCNLSLFCAVHDETPHHF